MLCHPVESFSRALGVPVESAAWHIRAGVAAQSRNMARAGVMVLFFSESYSCSCSCSCWRIWQILFDYKKEQEQEQEHEHE